MYRMDVEFTGYMLVSISQLEAISRGSGAFVVKFLNKI